jgi:hypothetical protein
MTKIKKAAKYSHQFIDYKIGIAGAMFMGGVVFSINYFSTYEITGSVTAALKQGGYTFLLGGIFMKGCENLATKIKKRTLAILLSVFIPSVLTLILTYSMHNLKGTPKPLESTIPTLLIIPATAVWGYRKRTNAEKSIKPLIYEEGTF